MIVYISGPMRGYRNYNRAAFFAAEQSLRKRFPFIKGFINPASLDGNTAGWTHADYMRRDIALLTEADAIYFLPGWVHSKGASAERQVAERIGLLILEDPDRQIWASFEDEPADVEEAASQEIQLFPGMDTSDEAEACCTEPPEERDDVLAEWERELMGITEESPAQTPRSEGRIPADAEDLSEHPRWKHIGDALDGEVHISAAPVGTPLPREANPVFADIDLVVDDGLPENVLRLDFGPRHIDFDVTWEDGELRLERKPDLEEISEPAEGDEFPNVGYVRRFMTLMGLPAPGSYLDYGSRRSA